MFSNHQMMRRFRGIAFLGNYLPRNCGIATFTHDLATAIATQAGDDQQVIVAAMNDLSEGYLYPDIVKFELRQDYPVDYSRAADFLNFSHIDVVSVQHEYGIYGGESGSNLLTFLRDLNRPSVVTCHTVMENPKPKPREVLKEIADRAEKLVVMSKKAFGFLENSYGIPREKIAYIPHGIHDAPFIDPNYFKDKFGVEGRRVLLTFGLLSPAKGIEYVIEALPDIIKEHPNITYVVLGATHPAVVRKDGESYRLSLQRRVRELGIENNVLFYPRFVEVNELLEYLGATDIFVTPYLHLEQITSGALSYAMGTGKAVVSTPYWHAAELLADGRGCLVPPRDSKALAKEINGLLGDEIKLSTMRKRAYTYCRSMVWSAVARSYLDLFDEVRSHAPVNFPTASALRSPIAATNLPTPKLDHILRLTDDTGPSRYACHAVPDWNYGYFLDDAAAALVAGTKYNAIYKDNKALCLTETCLSLLQTLIGSGDDSAGVAAGLDYTRRKVGTAGEDSIGKALWSLGYVVDCGPAHLVSAANDLFHAVLPKDPMTSPRGASYAILGASNYLKRFPGASEVRRFLLSQLNIVKDFVVTPKWFERWGSSDWPVAMQALFVAGRLFKNDEIKDLAKDLISDAIKMTQGGTVFMKQGDNFEDEELPTIAATFIEAVGAVYIDNRDVDLLNSIRSAVDWFLGVNRISVALYSFSTGGCHDAMTPAGVNRNQGTEATVFCLLSFLSLNELVTMKGVEK